MSRTTRWRRGGCLDRPGFAFLDVAVALGLLGLIAVAITSGVGRQQRAAQKLDDERTATRLADDALTTLRSGGSLAVGNEGTVKFTRLSDPAPNGQMWVSATAHVNTSDAAVIGLLPVGAVPAAEGAVP